MNDRKFETASRSRLRETLQQWRKSRQSHLPQNRRLHPPRHVLSVVVQEFLFIGGQQTIADALTQKAVIDDPRIGMSLLSQELVRMIAASIVALSLNLSVSDKPGAHRPNRKARRRQWLLEDARSKGSWSSFRIIDLPPREELAVVG